MKKLLIVCMLVSALITGCQSDEIISENSQIETTTIKETSTEHLPDFVLNTNNILFTADCNYRYDCQNPMKHCIMCIRTDGDVYTATTDLSGNFFRNLYECDNIVWDIAENITHIGTLTDDELSDLITYLNAEVLEVYENSALVKSDSIGEVTIPTVLPDGTSFQLKASDIIEVKYDGYIAESYPAQIHNIYDIIITEKTGGK